MGLEQLASIARTSVVRRWPKKKMMIKGSNRNTEKKIKNHALRTNRSQAKDKTSAYTMFKNISDKTVQLITA